MHWYYIVSVKRGSFLRSMCSFCSQREKEIRKSDLKMQINAVTKCVAEGGCQGWSWTLRFWVSTNKVFTRRAVMKENSWEQV